MSWAKLALLTELRAKGEHTKRRFFMRYLLISLKDLEKRLSQYRENLIIDRDAESRKLWRIRILHTQKKIKYLQQNKGEQN